MKTSVTSNEAQHEAYSAIMHAPALYDSSDPVANGPRTGMKRLLSLRTSRSRPQQITLLGRSLSEISPRATIRFCYPLTQFTARLIASNSPGTTRDLSTQIHHNSLRKTIQHNLTVSTQDLSCSSPTTSYLISSHTLSSSRVHFSLLAKDQLSRISTDRASQHGQLSFKADSSPTALIPKPKTTNRSCLYCASPSACTQADVTNQHSPISRNPLIQLKAFRTSLSRI
ncbi:hypothetical protein F511_36768 [Dorcoceras hygrometricum]|uniref:Uncharacterized protein n=1 Tax=Dorcoceras hygrometricum TaxID=472368 RepID=A0A2Z7BMF0_9LAMI|nr:hypothetical protein F511_36768 [Dorcoceras hygrometricum]